MTSLSIRKMNELSKKKKKGFTLVELIIVIAIIAILAAIAIPKFGQITKNANIKADIATAKNIHGIAAELVAEGTTPSDTNIPAKIDGAGSNMPNTKLNPSVPFHVEVEDDGDIVVTAGDNGAEIYPNSESYS
ncbi:MAG: prepilin-type N-terminal cleavage/methylation domain-containing protein [Clostridium beijerinckii]|nr:prepilin-type N-terminal cleavage/methylation domain-containing protein [Clostridium beijerinckii]